MEKIGVFFIFVAFAGLGIIGWVLNWVCWKNKFCCCKVYHNPTIQRIFWWFSFLFYVELLHVAYQGLSHQLDLENMLRLLNVDMKEFIMIVSLDNLKIHIQDGKDFTIIH